MKVFLDDLRPTPEGWVLAKTCSEAIKFLESGEVTDISLDHDLGDENGVGTGYDVILWMECKVYLDHWKPPRIYVHSDNSSAALKMKAGIESIREKALENKRNARPRESDVLHGDRIETDST